MNGGHNKGTRRDFLYREAAAGGSALPLNTMNAGGMGINSTASAPPALSAARESTPSSRAPAWPA
ncbi:MAG: Monoamine oxidase [Massilia sp.]|jgi:hypothetical protein|nr:Monoamine oxidase [Massilia sp.]